MSSPKRILLVVAILSAALVAWWVLDKMAPASTPESKPTTEEQVVVVAPGDDDNVSASVLEPDYDESVPTFDDTCLTPWQLESHPEIVADAERLESLLVTRPTMESYRGLSREEVESLAAQNDSAAMAVLGAMAMMRARGLDERGAVPYLARTELILPSKSQQDSMLSNSSAEFETARKWYYASAMHGRLFALTYIGEMYDLSGRGPVKEGLVSQEEYDALTREEKAYLNMTNVYTAAAHNLAGNPENGILSVISGFLVRSAPMDRLADEIEQEFRDALRDAGLPTIEIPESTMPSIEDMIEMVCDEYRPD